MAQLPTRFPDSPQPVLVGDQPTGPKAAANTADDEAGTTRSQKRKPHRPIGRREGEEAGAATIAERAKAELKSITGLDVDHVSAVIRAEDGWHVTVDLVELRRIPAATDVLAAYEALLGPTGQLLSYRRTTRYMRDQMIDAS